MHNKPTLYIVRHGHTSYNSNTGDSLDSRIRGWLNIPLDAQGTQEAAKTAKMLKGMPIETIYSSDLGRAQETANAIAETTGAPIELVKGLRPWHLGEMSGKTVRECAKAMQHLQENPDVPAPGGESFGDFYRLAKDMVDKLKSKAEEAALRGKAIVAVTHSRIDLALACILSDGDISTIPLTGGAVTGEVTEVQKEGNNWTIRTLGADEMKEEKEEASGKDDYTSHKRGNDMDEKSLSETLAKTARILSEGDRTNPDQELQAIVGDADDTRASTFAQFKPNPGTMQLPNPLSPIEGDEIFFAYMIPGAVMQAHDGSQWNILSYGSPDEIEIENRWYPRLHGIVAIGDIRRAIDQWVEPIQQTVPPPPPGVDYSALPVKVMDKETNKGDIDARTDYERADSGGW